MHTVAWKDITDHLKNPDDDYHQAVVRIMADLDSRYSGLGTRPMPANAQLVTPLSDWLTTPIVDENGDTRTTFAIAAFYKDIQIGGTMVDVPRRVIFVSRTGVNHDGGWMQLRIEMVGICRRTHPLVAEWEAYGSDWVEQFRSAILGLSKGGDPNGDLDDDVVVTATRPVVVYCPHPHLQTFFDRTAVWLNQHHDLLQSEASSDGQDLKLTLTLRS